MKKDRGYVWAGRPPKCEFVSSIQKIYKKPKGFYRVKELPDQFFYVGSKGVPLFRVDENTGNVFSLRLYDDETLYSLSAYCVKKHGTEKSDKTNRGLLMKFNNDELSTWIFYASQRFKNRNEIKEWLQRDCGRIGKREVNKAKKNGKG